MVANTSLNPIKIHQPVWPCPDVPAEAFEQLELRSALEKNGEGLVDRLCQEYPEMYSLPAVDPQDFEMVYQWFLS